MKKNDQSLKIKWGWFPAILIVLTLHFYCIDYLSFTTLSLQFYFAFVFCAIGIWSFAGTANSLTNEKFQFSISMLIMIVWGLYLFFHSIFVKHADDYQFSYYLSGVLYYFGILYYFQKKHIRFLQIYSLFAYMSTLQAIVCILQYSGIHHSGDLNFAVKGTFNNPNITAMYMVVSIPCFVQELISNKRKFLNLTILVLIIFAIILIKCRTAYLSMVVIAIVYLTMDSSVQKHIKRVSNKLKIAITLIVILVVCVVFVNLYFQKKASADGRLFVWKVSMEMITHKPLAGYGYGFFEKEYNLFQAEYFRSTTTTLAEKTNARHMYMPYNDFIEQAIQGGIPGMTIYFLLNILLIYQVFKHKNVLLISIILSLFIMSVVNFVVQAIPVWMLYLTCAAAITNLEKPILPDKLSVSIAKLGLAGLIITIYFGIGNYSRWNAQEKLQIAVNQLKEHKPKQALITIEKYLYDAGTSENYLRIYAKILISKGRIEEAKKTLLKSAQFTSEPSLYIDLARCYEYFSQFNDAEKCLLLITNMVPTNYRSRYYLMKLYERTGEKSKKITMANEILTLPDWPQNKEVIMYRKTAETVIKN